MAKPRLPPDPSARQAKRQAVLNQPTTATAAGSGELPEPFADQATGLGESIGAADRSMHRVATDAKYSVQNIAAVVGVFAILAGAVGGALWYFAKQDAAVRVLQDDTKDLKSKALDTIKSTVDTGYRLNALEQRVSGIEERSRVPPPPAVAASR